eukprot:2082324-Amphidinium_carterae.2
MEFLHSGVNGNLAVPEKVLLPRAVDAMAGLLDLMQSSWVCMLVKGPTVRREIRCCHKHLQVTAEVEAPSWCATDLTDAQKLIISSKYPVSAKLMLTLAKHIVEGTMIWEEADGKENFVQDRPYMRGI